MSGLNPAQQRYLRSALGTIEAHLQQIQVLAETHRGLARGRRRDLERFVESLRWQSGDLRRLLSLGDPPDEADSRWSIYTHLEFLNIQLIEMTASKLASYGDLDEVTARILNTQVLRMQQTALQEIATIAADLKA